MHSSLSTSRQWSKRKSRAGSFMDAKLVLEDSGMERRLATSCCSSKGADDGVPDENCVDKLTMLLGSLEPGLLSMLLPVLMPLLLLLFPLLLP